MAKTNVPVITTENGIDISKIGASNTTPTFKEMLLHLFCENAKSSTSPKTPSSFGLTFRQIWLGNYRDNLLDGLNDNIGIIGSANCRANRHVDPFPLASGAYDINQEDVFNGKEKLGSAHPSPWFEEAFEQRFYMYAKLGKDYTWYMNNVFPLLTGSQDARYASSLLDAINQGSGQGVNELPEGTDNFTGDVIFVSARAADPSGGPTPKSDSWTITCFYDFQLEISKEDMNQGTSTAGAVVPSGCSTSTILENDIDTTATLTSEVTNSSTATVSSSMSKELQNSTGVSLSIEANFKVGIPGEFEAGESVTSTMDYHTTVTTSSESSKSDAITKESSSSYTVNLPPYTTLKGINKHYTTTSEIKYSVDAPLQFKVIVFRVTRNSFPIVNNKRVTVAYKMGDHGVYDGKTPYPKLVNFYGQPNQNIDVTGNERRAFSARPYMPAGGVLTLNLESEIFTLGSLLPTRKLDSVKVISKTINVPCSKSVDLNDINYIGLNNKLGEYYEYKKLPKKWSIVSGSASIDDNNILTSTSDTTDMVKLKLTLTAPSSPKKSLDDADVEKININSNDFIVNFIKNENKTV